MFRFPFWLGLLCGLLTAFGARRRAVPAFSSSPLLDCVEDAVLVCDREGAVTAVNRAARTWFGEDGTGFSRLRYPSGQPVPPGQRPLALARRTPLKAAGYRYITADGERVLEITAFPRRGGGAAAICRDQTARESYAWRDAARQARARVIAGAARQLGNASEIDAVAQAAVDGAFALLGKDAGAKDAGAAVLYLREDHGRRLTRWASAPTDPPRRSKRRQAVGLDFDAALPLHWSMYVAREPMSQDNDYALPLVAGGQALGHLAVTCRDPEALEVDLKEALASLASLAAFALAARMQAAQAQALTAQADALWQIGQQVGQQEPEPLADFACAEVQKFLGADVCTALWRRGTRWRLAGTAWQSALLFPERYGPEDPALRDETADEAARTGQTACRTGVANPAWDGGPWRALNGRSGTHAVVSVAIAGGAGALTVYRATVYRAEAAAFSPEELRWLEIVALLLGGAAPGAEEA